MNMQKLMVYIGYTAGALFIMLGIAVMVTDLFPTTINENIKIIFGVVMILYGLYRIVILSFKNQQRDRNEESDE
ncbi:MAG: hypothetical protein FD143_1487 [Ignavibacteria bacterium]|nr:MAG: hypothetical protein FD143_1487 [Ignavibacteria bacterium]KAF0160537.1 MAG: hypothetical protein FD188_1711 [Ignavibacteria bacterium]